MKLTTISHKLHASLPEAVDVVVYAVEHEPARRRYELALELEHELKGEVRRSLPDEAQVLGVKELWHSTGEADPLDVLGCAHCLDPTFGQHGTYRSTASRTTAPYPNPNPAPHPDPNPAPHPNPRP